MNLSNTFNKFLMLSNQQYIENRVYEEDVTTEVTDVEEKVEGLERKKKCEYKYKHK